MQQSNNLLSSEEIQLLEQNYINSDSAPFIEKFHIFIKIIQLEIMK